MWLGILVVVGYFVIGFCCVLWRAWLDASMRRQRSYLLEGDYEGILLAVFVFWPIWVLVTELSHLTRWAEAAGRRHLERQEAVRREAEERAAEIENVIRDYKL